MAAAGAAVSRAKAWETTAGSTWSRSAVRRTVAITVAPAQWASWAAREATPPRTPWTRTSWPSTGPSAKTVRWAVMPGMPRLAPSSSLRWSGGGGGLVVGYDGVLGGGAEGAVGLGAVYPDPLSDAVDVGSGAHGVD